MFSQIKNRSSVFAAIIGLALVIFGACPAKAFTVSPVVLDEKAFPRDILKEIITVTNDSSKKADVYAFVNNINPAEGATGFIDPATADFASSLANWINITRGSLDLEPGEIKEVPVTIEVNLRAKPGMYHAEISFGEGWSYENARQNAIAGANKTAINLEVLEDKKERLQLQAFTTSKRFFPSFPVGFSFGVENIGNQSLVPEGSIRIYDGSGRELDSMKLNEGGAKIDPNGSLQLASIWQGLNLATWRQMGGFGRYKAMLDLSYGSSEQQGRLQDTVFFWVLPWKNLIATFMVLAVVAVAVALLWHKRYMRRFAPVLQESYSGQSQAVYEVQAREVAPPVSETASPKRRKVLHESKHVLDLRDM
jgi:hypothetical protein